MAVSVNLTTPAGLELKKAYVRIDTLAGFKESLRAGVNVYVSREAFLTGKPFVEQLSFDFAPDLSPDAPQVFAQAYAALKAQPRFAEAVDVIDPPAEPSEPVGRAARTMKWQ